jgi:hypothetical protein
VSQTSRFCGRWRASQTVALWAFSVRLEKPRIGCCVRMSKTLNLLSSVVATSLFISMSRRSKSTLTTPLPTLVSHRTAFMRRSKSFTSPLSYPAARHRSSSL